MNPIQTSPQSLDVDAAAGHGDPLDGLLTQIINGFFVLTDAHGAVSRWSEPAELLFGLDAAEVLGKRLFETLVDHAPPEADAWRRFLERGEAPRTVALEPVSAIYAVDRHSFPLELVFVPVKFDEGFDFSLFFEDLAFELPRNLMLTRMRQHHPVVVRALRQALETEPQPWDGGRTAGTLVVFRPTQPTPWVEQALATREAARAQSDLEGEERLDPDPGIHGDSIVDLDDAAAVVARLRSALERIADLEKTAAELPAALAELEAVRAVANAANAVATESLASKLTRALATLEEVKAGLHPRSGGEGGGTVLRRAELGKLRVKRGSEIAPLPTRAPRHGFDDVSQPLAVLDLRGRFCQLNPAFSKLVGYREHEFLKAVWPSVHDRDVLQEQTDQLQAMVTGELEALEFHSSYMHAQGLMVAVNGALTLVRDDAGEPLSLLLTAKER